MNTCLVFFQQQASRMSEPTFAVAKLDDCLTYLTKFLDLLDKILKETMHARIFLYTDVGCSKNVRSMGMLCVPCYSQCGKADRR